MKQFGTRKLCYAGILCAVAVVGSFFYIPVFGSKCVPVQHMVNILCAVLLGPFYGVGVAFCASLIRNLLGIGSLMAFPGSMFGALLCGLMFWKTKNIPLTLLAEVFGTAILGGLCAYPVAILFMGMQAGQIAFYAYVIPFLISTAGGAILSGILTQLALYSINLRIMDNKANVALNVAKYPLVVSMRNARELSLNNPIALLLLFTVAVIATLYWFFGTEYGSTMRATGANANMARAQGINTNSRKVVGLMLSNGLVALSGALLPQYQGFSDVSMGRGAIVIGLAAVIIGEVVFSKVFHNFALKLLAVSIGAVIYYLVIQVVLWLGLNTNDLKMLTAAVVALFLAVPYWKSRYFSKGGKAHA